MRRMNLDQIESGCKSTMCRLCESRDDGVDSRPIECPGHGAPGGEGDGARSNRSPCTFFGREQALAPEWSCDACLAPRMRKLNSRARSLRVYEGGDALERRNVLVLPDTEVRGRNAALGHDCGGFQHHQACAALGAAAEMHEMPVVGKAVFSRVLAHRRHTNAVRKSDGTKLERRKKRMAH